MRPTPKSPEQWQREADHDRWVESARRVTTREAATRIGWRPRHEAKRGWISAVRDVKALDGDDAAGVRRGQPSRRRDAAAVCGNRALPIRSSAPEH